MKRALVLIAVLAMIALCVAAVIAVGLAAYKESGDSAADTDTHTVPDTVPEHTAPEEGEGDNRPVFYGMAGTAVPTFAIPTDAECGIFTITVTAQGSILDGISAEVVDFSLVDGSLTLTLEWENTTDDRAGCGADFEIYRSQDKFDDALPAIKDLPSERSYIEPHSSGRVQYNITEYYAVLNSRQSTAFTFRSHGIWLTFSIVQMSTRAYCSVDYDIDSDGRVESCTMGYGFTSGVASLILSIREYGSDRFEYQRVLYLSTMDASLFIDEDGKLMMKVKESKDAEARYYNVSMLAGRLLIEDGGISHTGGGIPYSMLSHIEITRYEGGESTHTIRESGPVRKLTAYLSLLAGKPENTPELPDTPELVIRVYTTDNAVHTFTLHSGSMYTSDFFGMSDTEYTSSDRFVHEIIGYIDTIS